MIFTEYEPNIFLDNFIEKSDDYLINKKEINNFNIIDFFLFIKDNFIKILLLLSVFIIIYVIDHITQINSILYGLPSPIPGLHGIQTLQNNNINTNISSKKKKTSKK